MQFFNPFWNAMMWGGIGGVVGALYSLHWHVAIRQDFKKYYSMSYIVQPIMGLILGELVESSLKQSLIIFDHNWLRFFERPIVVVFVLLTVFSMAMPLIGGYRARLRAKMPPSADIPGD